MRSAILTLQRSLWQNRLGKSTSRLTYKGNQQAEKTWKPFFTLAHRVWNRKAHYIQICESLVLCKCSAKGHVPCGLVLGGFFLGPLAHCILGSAFFSS